MFGHTHLPFERTAAGGIELLNPGSVGMPFDGDRRAAYALLHEDGAVERRRVAYDHARASWARKSAPCLARTASCPPAASSRRASTSADRPTERLQLFTTW